MSCRAWNLECLAASLYLKCYLLSQLFFPHNKIGKGLHAGHSSVRSNLSLNCLLYLSTGVQTSGNSYNSNHCSCSLNESKLELCKTNPFFSVLRPGGIKVINYLELLMKSS